MNLELEQLTVSYGRRTILHDISIKFAPQKITALIGPNGCGKSTLLKTIMGFVKADNGQAKLNGKPISSFGRRDLSRRISYLPQENYCPDHMTLAELIELSAYSRRSLLSAPSKLDRETFMEAMKTVGLSNAAHKAVNMLSGGQKQRAFIALLLAQNTDIILMDEPVNHLDVKYQYTVMQLIRKLCEEAGKTVVIVLHDINLTAAFADHIVMMKHGRVVMQGDVEQKLTEYSIEDVFDIPNSLFRYNNRVMCQPFPGLTRFCDSSGQ